MKCKQNLISIGEMSKITGVNIKCLRYYDRIGVLKPTYINPDSGYRYYAVTQVYVVEIIRRCIELDIPLRDLAGYVDEEESIDFVRLLEFGRKAAGEKLIQIERGIQFLTSLHTEMAHLEACHKATGDTYRRKFSGRRFLVLPYQKGYQDKEFPRALHELFLLGAKEGCIPLYAYGLCRIYGEGSTEAYVYLEVLAEGEPTPGTREIPEGVYTCVQVEGCCVAEMETLFPEIQKEGQKAIVIETELPAGISRGQLPRMELQIWKPEEMTE